MEGVQRVSGEGNAAASMLCKRRVLTKPIQSFVSSHGNVQRRNGEKRICRVMDTETSRQTQRAGVLGESEGTHGRKTLS